MSIKSLSKAFDFLLIWMLFSFMGYSESLVEQYNAILSSGTGSIDRIKMSNCAKDNLALVRISGTTYLISSSIINGFFIKSIPQATAVMAEALSLYPDEYLPVSVMDLLYLDVGDMPASFVEKLDSSRANPMRKLFEKLIIATFGKKSPSILRAVLSPLILEGDNSLGGSFQTSMNGIPGIKNERLEALRDSIVDFLFRLRNYANDVAVILSDSLEQSKESFHLLANKETLTKLDTENVLKTKCLNKKIIIDGGDRNSQVGAIELVLSQIDIRLLKLLGSKFSRTASTILDEQDYDQAVFPKIEDISEWMISLFKIISSPWCGNLGGMAGNYMRAITHTEQMVDWLCSHFRENILVKISGKAPCVKCSHYIQYAVGATRVRDTWNQRVIVGFNTGWRNMEGDNPERNAYRYPVKVFHAIPELGSKVRKFQPCEDSPENLKAPGTYDDSDFGTNLGVDKSNCYAIENVDEYTGQLTMRSDGSIVQITADRGSDPMLVPFDEAPIHDEPSSAGTEE